MSYVTGEGFAAFFSRLPYELEEHTAHEYRQRYLLAALGVKRMP